MTSNETVALVPTGTGFLHVTGGVQDLGAVNVSGGGWQTALDLDFTAETTQTLAPNGNYTIGGLTWKKENSAQEHASMVVTNGTGLVIQPGHSGGLSAEYGNVPSLGGGSADRSAPLLWLALSQLGITNLDWTTGLRIWVNVSSQTLSAGGDGLVWGIDNDPGTGFSSLTNWYSMFAARSSTSSSQPVLTAFQYSGGLGGSAGSINMPTGTTSWTTANATSVLYINSIVPFGGAYQQVVSYGTAYSAGWTGNTVPWATSFQEPAAGLGTAPAIGYANQSTTSVGSALGIVLAGTGNVAFASASITVSRLRIDYRL
jgi:hypothetical protein